VASLIGIIFASILKSMLRQKRVIHKVVPIPRRISSKGISFLHAKTKFSIISRNQKEKNNDAEFFSGDESERTE
jgi:hypothetical protein